MLNKRNVQQKSNWMTILEQMELKKKDAYQDASEFHSKIIGVSWDKYEINKNIDVINESINNNNYVINVNNNLNKIRLEVVSVH